MERSMARPMATTLALVGMLAAPCLAQEDGEKAEVVVSNHMPGPIKMRVDYVFKTYSWTLVDAPI